MISVSGKKWLLQKKNKNFIEKLKQEHNFSQILSELIVSRKFDENEIHLIENDLELNNVFKNIIDFNQSIDFLVDIIDKKENICIFGDYDVDGSTATSLFIRFFESINQPFFFFIPDREKDGYGPNKKIFEKLILKKPKLIIMVDCGSNSIEAIDFLNKNKIKSIVIDHHEIDKPYPKANYIINPKKNNGYIKYDYLCATSLVYFFLDLLSKKIKTKINLNDYLIYVLLATVSDVMPLRKLNRLISIKALKRFNIKKNPFLNKIYSLNNKKNKINIDDLGYLVAPILNSGGRLGKSNYATELLSSDNEKIIISKSLELIKLNNKRKKIETSILKEIDFEKIDENDNGIIFYYNHRIHEGLLGIIAARLKDFFNKPTIVITSSNNILKGSARSVFNYNIGRLIKNALDKDLILNGGGHSMAAGFTLKKSNLSKLESFVINNFSNSKSLLDYSLKYDAEISSMGFNKEFFDDIKKIEPFGSGNPLPIFLIKDLKIIKTRILNDKHVFSIFKSKIGYSIKSIAFNSLNTKVGDYLINYKNHLSVLGQFKENFWNNKSSLQLVIKDLII